MMAPLLGTLSTVDLTTFESTKFSTLLLRLRIRIAPARVGRRGPLDAARLTAPCVRLQPAGGPRSTTGGAEAPRWRAGSGCCAGTGPLALLRCQRDRNIAAMPAVSRAAGGRSSSGSGWASRSGRHRAAKRQWCSAVA